MSEVRSMGLSKTQKYVLITVLFVAGLTAGYFSSDLIEGYLGESTGPAAIVVASASLMWAGYAQNRKKSSSECRC